MSSTKEVTGHLLGGAGVVDAATTVLALAREQLPPTKSLDEPDSKCDLNHLRDNAVAKSVDRDVELLRLVRAQRQPGLRPHPQAADAAPQIPSRRSEVGPVHTRLTTGDTIAQRQTRKGQTPVEPTSSQLLLSE